MIIIYHYKHRLINPVLFKMSLSISEKNQNTRRTRVIVILNDKKIYN